MRAAGRAMRMQPVYEMWHAGMSLRRIADVMGFSPKTAGKHVSDMRLEGWDMPHRYRGWDTRENAR
jgi:uncharacterized protein YjcR